MELRLKAKKSRPEMWEASTKLGTIGMKEGNNFDR